MMAWNRNVVAAYAPAMVGWCLALASWLRLEQLRDDLHAKALLPVLQGGAVTLLVLTLASTLAASAILWRARRPPRRTTTG